MGKRKAPAKAEEEEYEQEDVAPAKTSTRSTRQRASTRNNAAAKAASKSASPPRTSKRRKASPTSEDPEDVEEKAALPASKKAVSPQESPAASEVEVEQLPFKNMSKSKLAEYQAAGRRPIFKNFKQIIKLEPSGRDLPPSVPSYNSINAPPSLVPAKKYCDLTGFEAPYTDPRTGLRYASAEVFQYLQTLPYDYVQRFLALRNAASKLR